MKIPRVAFCMVSALWVSCSPVKMEYLNAKALLTLSRGDLETEAPEHGESAKLYLANRWVLKSTLDEIFGANHVGSITCSLIMRNGSFFGGSTELRSARECPNVGTLSTTKTPMIMAMGSVREALRTQACERMTQLDPAIRHAAQMSLDLVPTPQSDLSTFLFTDTQAPTGQDAERVFRLFYVSDPYMGSIQASLDQLLETLRSQGQSPLEQWRYLFLTVCLSTGWQVL
jgi:hypothetical protein